ncbi:asparagine synthase (glutamine-hydrolyzing), partial [mine drainage metagenome]
DGACAVIMNGEIYNAPELRGELTKRGHRFACGSDAEVVVHLYEEVGARAFERLSGMYAIALWERERGIVLLARDRIGQKPLLVQAVGGSVRFASDLAALLAADTGSAPTVDPVALDRYLTYRTPVGRQSMLVGIERLLPGEVAVLRDGAILRRYFPSLPPR